MEARWEILFNLALLSWNIFLSLLSCASTLALNVKANMSQAWAQCGDLPLNAPCPLTSWLCALFGYSECTGHWAISWSYPTDNGFTHASHSLDEVVKAVSRYCQTTPKHSCFLLRLMESGGTSLMEAEARSIPVVLIHHHHCAVPWKGFSSLQERKCTSSLQVLHQFVD